MAGTSTLGGNIGIYSCILLIVAYGYAFWTFIVRAHLTGALNCLSDRRPSRSFGLALCYWTSPIFIAALWGLASYSGLASARTIPTPGEFVRSFWELVTSGTLLVEALISFRRVLIGFVLASIVGVPLGL